MTSVDDNIGRVLSVASGGPSYRFERRLRLEPPRRRLRLLFLPTVFVWGIAVLLAVIDLIAGRGFPSLLTMTGFHARALIGLPLLLGADLLLEARVEGITRALLRNEIVAGDDVARWDRLVARLERWRDRAIPEMVPLLFILVLIGASVGRVFPQPIWALPLFHGAGAGATESWSWWWYVIFIQPLFLFLVLRFVWHWLLWSAALSGLARLNLRLQATHPDRAGGIGFVASALDGFNLAVLGVAVVLAGTWGDEILATGVKAAAFAPQFVAMVSGALALPLLPYLPLSLQLFQSRRLGSAAYGQFVREYIRAFDDKWIARTGEPALGTPDVQTLADAGGSFDVINTMRSTVFARQAVVRLVALAAGPVLPLILARMPAKDIARMILAPLT